MTHADLVQRTRTRVIALLALPGMNKVLLAYKAGVHRNTLDGVEGANWSPRGETLDAIIDALDRLEK